MSEIEKLQRELEKVRQERISLEKRMKGSFAPKRKVRKPASASAPKMGIPKFRMPSIDPKLLGYAFMALIALVVVVGIVMIWPEGAEEVSEFGLDVELCDAVNCYVDAEYDRGDKVYVKTQANNLLIKDGKVHYQQWIEVIDPRGRVIEEVSGLQLDDELNYDSSKPNVFILRNDFGLLANDVAGDYDVRITVADVKRGVSKSITRSFSVG